MKVLVSGGMGFIGSHTVVELVKAGYEPIIVDDLSNSKREVLNRLKMITGCDIPFYELNICDYEAIKQVFDQNEIGAVIHFSGFKCVPESVKKPLEYYKNNILTTLNILNAMALYGVKNFVFSSSATVYGDKNEMPLKEDYPLSATSPYGRTKLMIEDILRDYSLANSDINIAILRYFNPIGAHESGLIGEDPEGIPNNLMPYITQVSIGEREYLRVFGDDYPTPDGTGIRDYIHVVDLAVGHIKALEKLVTNPGLVTYNLGTGKGSSVFDVLHAYEEACGKKIPYKVLERRSGDVAIYLADVSKAKAELGFEAKYNLLDMCKSSYKWQKNNPHGYDK